MLRITLVIALSLTGCTLKTMSHWMRSDRIDAYLAENPSTPDKIKAAILEGQPVLGMTYEQLKLAIGTPMRSYSSTSATGTVDHLVYGKYQHIFLTNGIVTDIQG